MSKRSLTATAAARVAGVSPNTIRSLCDRGELRHTRIGGIRRIDPDVLDQFIAQHTHPATARVA